MKRKHWLAGFALWSSFLALAAIPLGAAAQAWP